MAYSKFTSRLNSLKALALLVAAGAALIIAAPAVQAQTCVERCRSLGERCAEDARTRCRAEANAALARCEEAGGSTQTCEASYNNTYNACLLNQPPCGCELCPSTYPDSDWRLGIQRYYYCQCGPSPLSGGDEQACGIRNYEGECTSPVLIDVNGDGFRLTNVDAGVLFDLRGTGSRLRTAWTEPNSDDGWLVLDRNNNGAIDDGTELFGNFTPQPESCNKNGFLALAEFDKTINGGNSDGIISQADGVFNRLRLWQDRNHNGVSESDELIGLTSADVLWLDLDFKPSKQIDEHGNGFRYRAKVRDARGGSVGRWAWDVWLMNRFVQ